MTLNIQDKQLKVGDEVRYNQHSSYYRQRWGKIIATDTVGGEMQYLVEWIDITELNFYRANELVKIMPPNQILKEIL